MKNFKKTLAGISALTLTLSMTACGGDSSSNGGSDTPAEETTTATTTTAATVELNTATLAVLGIAPLLLVAAAAGAVPVMPERTCFTISSIFTLFISMFFSLL